MNLWTKLTTSDKGASMVEYALLVVLIAIVAIIAIALVGDNVAALFERTASELNTDPVTPETTP